MTHCNGTIRNYRSTEWRQYEEIEVLKLKLHAAIGQRDELHAEFRNVIESVKAYGYIELYCEDTKESITLVKKKVEPEPAVYTPDDA